MASLQGNKMNYNTKKKLMEIVKLRKEIKKLAALNNNVGKMIDLLKFNTKNKAEQFLKLKDDASLMFDDIQKRTISTYCDEIIKQTQLKSDDFKIESNMSLFDNIILRLKNLRDDYKTATPSTITNKIRKTFKGRSAVPVFNRRDKVYEFIDNFIGLIISFKTNIKLNLDQLNQITEYEYEIIELKNDPSLRAQSHAGGGNPSSNKQNNVNKIISSAYKIYDETNALLLEYSTYDDADKLLQELNNKSVISYKEDDLIIYSPENVNQLIVSIKKNNKISDLDKEKLIPMLETIIKLKNNEIQLINTSLTEAELDLELAELDRNSPTNNLTEEELLAQLEELDSNSTTNKLTAAELPQLEELDSKSNTNKLTAADLAKLQEEVKAAAAAKREPKREEYAAEREAKRKVAATEREAKKEAAAAERAAKKEADAAERAAKKEADAAEKAIKKDERLTKRLTKKGGSLKKTKKVKKSNKKSKTLKK